MKPSSHRNANTCLNCSHCLPAKGHLFCTFGEVITGQSGGDMFSADFEMNGEYVTHMDDDAFERLWVSHSVTEYQTCDEHLLETADVQAAREDPKS